jgi:integrase
MVQVEPTPPSLPDPPRPRSLADLIALLEADTGLPPGRRRDMISALRSTARLFHCQPGQVAVQPRSLRESFAQVCPAAEGISPYRLNNIRSLVLAALRHAGAMTLPRKARLASGDPWASLWSRLPTRRLQIGLSRLSGYLAASGIPPAEITAEVFPSFRDALEQQSLTKNPVRVYQSTCRLWNEARQLVEGWPDLLAPEVVETRRYSMDWQAFPISFQEDVAGFLTSSANPDVLADDYARPVRPATVTTRRAQLRMIATALVRSGFPLERLENLATLVELANAKAAMRFFLERKGGQTSKFTHQHALLLQTIAKHWVKAPAAQVLALQQLRRRLLVKDDGMTEKNQARLRQFDNDAHVEALLHLPQRVFAELARKDDGSIAAARWAMRALAVELLLHAPIRLNNLAGLRTDRHLVSMRVRSVVTIHLVIRGEETKNSEALELQLAEGSIALLALYLERYHPRLAPQGSPWLFPNRQGERCGNTVFARVAHEAGLQMNVHLFRHLAAKLHLKLYPEDEGTPQRLLGHKSINTTRKYYVGFRTAAAHQRYEQVLKILDTASASVRPKSRRIAS